MGLSSFDGRDPTLELFDTTLVGLERAMSGSALRQQVIANNIANANTPNFKASDVDFHTALEQAFAGQPTVDQIDSTNFSVQTDSASTGRMDGNNVDIDQQMANLSENTLDYQSLESVMASRISILKTAIGQVQ
jgi:flagellar basal-body rod protein FlgB